MPVGLYSPVGLTRKDLSFDPRHHDMDGVVQVTREGSLSVEMDVHASAGSSGHVMSTVHDDGVLFYLELDLAKTRACVMTKTVENVLSAGFAVPPLTAPSGEELLEAAPFVVSDVVNMYDAFEYMEDMSIAFKEEYPMVESALKTVHDVLKDAGFEYTLKQIKIPATLPTRRGSRRVTMDVIVAVLGRRRKSTVDATTYPRVAPPAVPASNGSVVVVGVVFDLTNAEVAAWNEHRIAKANISPTLLASRKHKAKSAKKKKRDREEDAEEAGAADGGAASTAPAPPALHTWVA